MSATFNTSGLKSAVLVAAISAVGVYVINPSFIIGSRGQGALQLAAWSGVSVIIAGWIHSMVPATA